MSQIMLLIIAIVASSIVSFVAALLVFRNHVVRALLIKWRFILRYHTNRSVVSLKDEEGSWYMGKRPLLWAYAGGGHLHQYGNSLEAIDESIKLGFRIIEIDVSLTSDNVPVVTHWFRPDNQIMFNQTPTVEAFKKTLINDKYHGLTLKELFDRYDDVDVYFSIDPAHLVALQSEFDLVSYIVQNASVKFLNRIIYQVYSIPELLRLRQLSLPFASLHYVLECLNNGKNDFWMIPHLMPYLTACGVRSVSLRDRPVTYELIDAINAFNAVNIRVSVTGVDYKNRADELLKLGVSCFNTRLLTPNLF